MARVLLLLLVAMSLPARAACLTEACLAKLLGVDESQVEAVVPLARHARPENTIILQGAAKDGRFVVSEHTLVPAHPAPSSPAPIPSPSREPIPHSAGPRATWIWHAADWQKDGTALLAWARSHGIGLLFITVPMDEVHGRTKLARFVRQAHRQHIAVWSVDGDPHMVLQSQHTATVRLVQAYAGYNRSVSPDARLDGIQFDIEPYLLPDDLSAEQSDALYLTLVHKLRGAAGSLKLDFVVPFWWSGRTALLAGLARDADGLTVMDYRTDAQQVYEFAVPFLDWAQANGKTARIALEAGPIAPETQRRYHRTDGAADLLLVELDARPVLVALRAPLAQLPQGLKGYRLGGTRELDGSATTFAKDSARLNALLPALETDFSAWHGFAGMAVHGLR
jgi:hypothetical protein